MPKYLDNFKRFVSSIGDLGRYGDTYIVHASKGETVVPTEVLYKNPALKKQLFNTMRDMGIEPERSESIQGQVYEAGDEFKYHTDYFEYGSSCWKTHGKDLGQRTWTFMIYLNDVEKGGHTYFKLLNLSIKPEKGMALAWYNLKEDSEIEGNHYTVHAELPVEAGNKYVITKWFKSNSV